MISVIIPVYNVEKYLDRCIESIVNQTYTDLEIILVDDGSPDNCPKMCDQWAKKDARIRVIHKKNNGLGMARNTGIENAHGDYICFFDSDDYVDPHTIELAHHQMITDHSEIVYFGFSNVNEQGRITKSVVPTCKQTVFSNEEILNLFLPQLFSSKSKKDSWHLNISVWTAMFSMELIRRTGWRFVSEREIISEDSYSLLVLFKDVKRISVLRKALYFYYKNTQSLSRVYRKDRFDKIVHYYHSCRNASSLLKYPEIVNESIASLSYGFSIAALKQLVSSNESLRVKLAEIKKITCHEMWHDPLFQTAVSRENLQRRIFMWCMRHHLTIPCYILCKLKNKEAS